MNPSSGAECRSRISRRKQSRLLLGTWSACRRLRRRDRVTEGRGGCGRANSVQNKSPSAAYDSSCGGGLFRRGGRRIAGTHLTCHVRLDGPMVRCRVESGGACDIAGESPALPTAQSHLTARRRREVVRRALDLPGARRTAERSSGPVSADEVKDLRGIVRIWTRLTHRPSDDPSSGATARAQG